MSFDKLGANEGCGRASGLPMISPPATGFTGPVKRSVTIAGHQTSISLEPLFWTALERASTIEGLPLNALIAQIDVLRIAAPDPPNLASALRTWRFDRAGTICDRLENDSHLP